MPLLLTRFFQCLPYVFYFLPAFLNLHGHSDMGRESYKQTSSESPVDHSTNLQTQTVASKRDVAPEHRRDAFDVEDARKRQA